MLDRSSVLRIRGLRQSLNMPWKHQYVPPCGVFPLLCPDVNCHNEPQLQQSKPSCCGSLFLDTWKQSGYFPPQKELCGCSAHKKKKKKHMVLVDSVSVFRMSGKESLDSLTSLFLPALPVLIEFTQSIGTNGSGYWLCPELNPLIYLGLHARSWTWIEMVSYMEITKREGKTAQPCFQRNAHW